MKKSWHIISLIGITILSACAMGSDYQRPSIEIPLSYKEDYGEWRQAVPQDENDRGAWWSIYHDSVLDDLEQQLVLSNQNLKAAEAAYRQANAVTDETHSALFPSLTLNSSAGLQKGTMPTPVAADSLYGSASWTLDVWGHIRRGVESDEAKAQASSADLAAAKLSMQAALATNYFDLRAQDELKRLYDQMAEVNHKALELAQRHYDTGIGDLTAVLAAQSQLEDVQSQSINTSIRRAKLEHAIAALVGKTPAEFSLPPEQFFDAVPEIPVGLPSALLERRPDIASSERMVAAANAQIGVAKAAWFPDLTLSASSGYTSMALGKLLQISNSFWAFGPTLAETLFDGGAREARAKKANAAYDQSVANYRQSVLTAFQQVEDNLAASRILTEQQKVKEKSVTHARTIERLMAHHYMDGLESYSNVLMAKIASLEAEQSLLSIRRERLEASIGLVQALGGEWERSHKD
ncbi:MAG: efflux transporter outer membrane subunit [Alphaproteobacteria bacterium]|nr:efflux transporter outer membrane subunit [Alphaproteobacteria bacterium]